MSVYTLRETICRNARRVGLSEIGEIDIQTIEHDVWVRKICEDNSCRSYNTTWACPPAVGTLEECRDRCRSFQHMLLFNRKYDLTDSFDFEGITSAMQHFKDTVDAFDSLVGPILGRHLFLSKEGCGKCKTCTWPGAPCRFPDMLHHSIEGYGFNIMKLAEQAGLHYNSGQNTVTFFGALLYND